MSLQGVRGPVLTIGIPVYNGARFLRGTLDSIVNQSFRDFEIAISDNASTDETADICRDYSAKDPRIIYLRQPKNIGGVANWNFLVTAARGRYFKWASANDLYAPVFLERCIEALEAEESLALCYSRTCIIDESGTMRREYAHDIAVLDPSPAERFRRVCQEMHLNNAQAGVIRLDVLRRTRLERTYVDGDIPLMAELALLGGFQLIPQQLFFRRMGKNSWIGQLGPGERASYWSSTGSSDRQTAVWSSTFSHLGSICRARLTPREFVRATGHALRLLYWKRGTAIAELRSTTRARKASGDVASTVALLGAYSSRNLGDTAIQMAVVQNLRARRRGLEIVGVSHDAVDTLITHGLRGWTLQGRCGRPDDPRVELIIGRVARVRRKMSELLRIFRHSRHIDLLIISGSGQLEDFWGGPWAHPWTLLMWASCCRIRGAKVAVLGTGLDDISTKLGGRLIRWMLRLASYRSFRDSGTLDALRRLGFSGAADVCPDLAFSLMESGTVLDTSLQDGKYIVICPISERAFRQEAKGVHRCYMQALADTAQTLLEDGHDVVIANSQLDMDGPVAEQLYQAIKDGPCDASRLRLVRCNSVSDYLAVVGGSSLVLASRLHGLILAALKTTPVVAVSYGRKVRQLMNDLGIESQCIELADVSSGSLARAVMSAFEARDATRQRLKHYVHASQRSLQLQYDRVLTLLDRAA